ncbi:hypothetical protein B0H19DRAFT_545339 [Mycena capillaripes]|nr:hypothetical protein B0H19DRAFT_545339 [Mycena capillaripes]
MSSVLSHVTLPAGTNAIPSWALAMISATPTPTTFDLAAASDFLSSISTSASPPRNPSPTLQPSDTTKTPAPHSSNLSRPATSSSSPAASSSLSPTASSSLSPAASSSPPPISSDTTGSPSQTVMSSSSAISSTNITPSATPTKDSKESMRRDTLPIGAIIGILLAICSIIALGALLFWFRRRRRRQKDSYVNIVPAPYPILVADIATAIPSNNNSADNSDARRITKVRQQFLRNELRAAQENIVHIQNLERQTSSARGRAGRILRLLSSPRASIVGSESRNTAILRLRERNEMLTARIRELEAELDSPALGLSDGPPPGYIE